MKKLIVVVEDEPDILDLVTLNLEKAFFEVAKFPEAEPLWDFLKDSIPDLIILDLMLPDADGLELCRSIKGIREYSGIPIIILTAKDDESDKVLGLEIGADDYVTKPFSPKELVARVKAVLRRSDRIGTEEEIIKIGDSIRIDSEKYKVYVNDNEINLTTTEFRILKILSQKIDKVYSRSEILDDLWGSDKYVVDRTIDVHIKHLREKLGAAGNIIKNVRGIGYKVEL
ncbi:response regulator [candidate division KSB1 bacterium]